MDIQIIPKKKIIGKSRTWAMWGVRVILPKSASHESSNSTPDFLQGGEIPV